MQMQNDYNKKLFWYGVKAKIKQFLGGILIFFSFIFGLVFTFINVWLGLIVFLGLMIFGIVLLMKGKSQRFDFQRQSGTIVHGGDGWGNR